MIEKLDKKPSEGTTHYVIDELKERVKELNCLYGLTNIVKDKTLSFDEALQKVVELIPPAWKYPESTCARITIYDKEIKTKNFNETKWKQISDIIVDDKKIGDLEVCYLEEKPEADEGPFLLDERRLLDAITDLLGKFLVESHIKAELEKHRKKIDQRQKTLSIESKEEEKKHDWEVLLDLLSKTDPRTLLRLTRKMVYYLYRYENEKITALLGNVCPVDGKNSKSEWCGINMPNPRQDLESLNFLQKQIF